MERKDAITFQGSPLTLIGNEVKVSDKAEDFTAVNGKLEPVSLSSFDGKILLISSVPSLDTPVCDSQTRKFNEKAANLSDKVKVLTISMDLPFAQNRFCSTAGINNLEILSDYKDADFGTKYGLLIKELRLLSRAVIVVDENGKISYIQVVREITNEPDYEKAIDAVKKLL